MSVLLNKVWAYLCIAAAIAGALLMAVLKIRQGGVDAERAAQARRDAEARSTANEADRMVERAGDGELDELRRKWTRGG